MTEQVCLIAYDLDECAVCGWPNRNAVAPNDNINSGMVRKIKGELWTVEYNDMVTVEIYVAMYGTLFSKSI